MDIFTLASTKRRTDLMRMAGVVPEQIFSPPPKTLLTKDIEGRSFEYHLRKKVIFSQGDPADAVFYLQSGRVKVTVVSKQGKEATVGLLGAGDFFGEGCLAGQALRTSTATVTDDANFLRLHKKAVLRLLRTDQKFSQLFRTYLLYRNIRFQRGPARPAIQFERKAVGSNPPFARAIWQ